MMSGKRGNPNWGKGHSGNPSGRPKVLFPVIQLAQQHGKECIEGLVALARDESQPGAVRLRAYEVLLDRGYGRAQQNVEIGKPGDFSALNSEAEILDLVARELGPVTAQGIKLIVDNATKNKQRVRPTLDETPPTKPTNGNGAHH